MGGDPGKVQVLPQRPMLRRRRELEIAGRRQVHPPADLAPARGSGRGWQLRAARALRDPAAVHQHAETLARELERRDDFVARAALMNAIVEIDLVRRIVFAVGAQRAIAQAFGMFQGEAQHAPERLRRLRAHGLVLRLQGGFLGRAMALPVAQGNRCGNHDESAHGGPQTRLEAPPGEPGKNTHGPPATTGLHCIMRIIVIVALLLIFASLGSALFYLFRDRGQRDRVAKALTLRVGLSLALFLFLMVGYYFGWFGRTGL